MNRTGLFGNAISELFPEAVESSLDKLIDLFSFGAYGELREIVSSVQAYSGKLLENAVLGYVAIKFLIYFFAFYSFAYYVMDKRGWKHKHVYSGLFSLFGVSGLIFFYATPPNLKEVAMTKIGRLITVFGSGETYSPEVLGVIIEPIKEGVPGLFVMETGLIAYAVTFVALAFVFYLFFSRGTRAATVVSLYPLGALIYMALSIMSLPKNIVFAVLLLVLFLMFMALMYVVARVLVLLDRLANKYIGWVPTKRRPKKYIDEEVAELGVYETTLILTVISLFCIGFFESMALSLIMFVFLSFKVVGEGSYPWNKSQKNNKTDEQID